MLVLLLAWTISSQGGCTRCGNQLYEQFELEPGYTNLNHGQGFQHLALEPASPVFVRSGQATAVSPRAAWPIWQMS